MSVDELVAGCMQMLDGCTKIKDAITAPTAALLVRIREMNVELDEHKHDLDAMKEWGSRMDARRIASSKKEDAARAELVSRIDELCAENLALVELSRQSSDNLRQASLEIDRLRQDALETCSVSRTVMLQNENTRLERLLAESAKKLRV